MEREQLYTAKWLEYVWKLTHELTSDLGSWHLTTLAGQLWSIKNSQYYTEVHEAMEAKVKYLMEHEKRTIHLATGAVNGATKIVAVAPSGKFKDSRW